MKNIKTFKLFESKKTTEFKNYIEDILLNLTDVGFEIQLLEVTNGNDIQIRIINCSSDRLSYSKNGINFKLKNFKIDDNIIDVLTSIKSYGRDLNYQFLLMPDMEYQMPMPIMRKAASGEMSIASQGKIDKLASIKSGFYSLDEYLSKDRVTSALDIYLINRN